jgi:hypothetical protein
MGVRFGSQFTNTVANPLPPNAIPTLVYVLPNLVLPTDNAVVAIAWELYLTTSPSTTSLLVAIYRNISGAGSPISGSAWTLLVGSTVTGSVSGNYVDTPGGGTTAYSMTVAQVGATSASSLFDGCLLAFVL